MDLGHFRGFYIEIQDIVERRLINFSLLFLFSTRQAIGKAHFLL